jgi:fumarylpyruvate hydrolase
LNFRRGRRGCACRRRELFPGDITYCGTPENVGPVVARDVMTGHINGFYEINVKVV